MKSIVILLLSVIALAGCGRKGPLIPPEALVPATVQNLAVRQQDGDLVLTWTAPAREQGGRPLKDLAGFRLQRRYIAGDGSDCAACSEAWRTVAEIDADFPGQARRDGANFRYAERGLAAGRQYQYRLTVLSRSGGSSGPATTRSVTVRPPLAPPQLTLAVTPTAVRLGAEASLPAGAKLLGYNIYRREAGGAVPYRPLNPQPSPATVWDDTQVKPGSSYRYSATVVVELAGDPVESAPSPEREIAFVAPEFR